MHRLLILLMLASFTTQVHAQRRPGTRIFVDLGGGTTNAVEPYSAGYRSPTFGLFHAHAGFRFMMNDKFGYRIIAGYDKIYNAGGGKSLPFQNRYMRGSAEAIVDLGELLGFDEFTYLFGLFLHGGVGYSNLSGSGKSASMGHFVNGLTLTTNLGDRFSINFDLTRVNHVYQQVTFDLQNTYNEKGFDGMIFDISLGVSVRLGKDYR